MVQTGRKPKPVRYFTKIDLDFPAGKLVLFMGEYSVAKLRDFWHRLSSPGPFLRVVRSLLILFLLSWMLFSWGLVGVLIIRDYVALPVWDYWRVAQYYENYRAYDFSILWQQHNEHRIIFPEILYSADILYLQGRQLLPLSLSCLFYLGSWVVLAWSFTLIRKDDRFPHTICVLVAGLVIGSQASSQVLNTPFLLQWTLVQFASLLSFAFLSKLAGTSQRRYLAATLGCVVVANYSSGNGLLLWPIVVLAAFLAGVKRGYIVLLGITAALSTGLYFVGYHFSKETNLLAILRHPSYALGFLSSYLSMPFARDMPVVGLLNLCLFLILTIVVVRHRLWRERPVVVYFGSYLFTLASIFITMSGRMDPGDYTYAAAQPARYVIVPLVNWAVLLLASLWMSVRLKWKRLSWWKIAATALLLILITAAPVHFWMANEELNVMQQQASVLSIESGIFDPDLIRKLFPSPPYVASYLPALRRDHLAVFSEERYAWIGKDSQRLFHLSNLRLGTGSVEKIVPVTGGLQVSGWVESAEQLRNLVLVNEKDQVVGLGRRNTAGIIPSLRPVGKRARLAWIGFINGRFSSSAYRAFLVEEGPNHNIAQIGDSFLQPAVTLQDPGIPGTLLAPLVWEERDNWVENLLPSGLNAGDSHSSGFLSSWRGSDETVGVAVSAPFPVANGCFVLPVLHGPTVTHQIVRFLSADGEILSSVPMDPNALSWRMFRISTITTRVRVLAQDAGTGYGEWSAVGQPRTCD